MSQIISTGPTIASQYGRFGISNQRMCPHPDSLFGMIFGLSNTGKTSLIASNPGALICNCDTSSTPSPSPSAPPWPAQFWPAVNKEGRTVDAENRPIVLRWEEVIALKDKLIEAAKNNAPRPKVFVLDSIATAMGLLKDWIIRKHGKADFRQLDGRAAYDAMYDQLVMLAGDLRRSGYGVYFLGHLRNNTIPLGDDRYVIKLDLDVTDGFWKRVYPLAEFIFSTYKEKKTRTKQVAVPVPGRPGVNLMRDEVETYTEYGLIFNNEELHGILKARLKLPESFVLPEQGAWASLCQLYEASQTPEPTPTPVS